MEPVGRILAQRNPIEIPYDPQQEFHLSGRFRRISQDSYRHHDHTDRRTTNLPVGHPLQRKVVHQADGKRKAGNSLGLSVHRIHVRCEKRRRFPKTPAEIQEKLDEEECHRIKFVKSFLERQKIDLLRGENYKNALEDLAVLMEKYISINYEDKNIFTRDRYAYPIQISATDDDSSSVEETSLDDKPLQCTPIFFDNKKVIQKQKKCDDVVMVFKREVRTYFTNSTFQAIIEVKRGAMHIDLRKYVLEEDIENVLSRIIRCN